MLPAQFRYVETSHSAVVLRLYRDPSGIARGDVSGPILDNFSFRPLPCVDRCILNAEQAYYAAIRLANASDSELVVAGDDALWDAGWGELLYGEATPLIVSTLPVCS